MRMDKIPIAFPYCSDELIESVGETIKSGRWARGRHAEEFEKEFASYIGKKSAFAVNSGTTALRLALRSLNLKKKTKVIVPDMSFIATAQSVILEGLDPVFLDVNYDGNLDPTSLEEFLSNSYQEVGAVMLVHLHGKAAQVVEISEICRKYNVPLIEDCSQATGVEIKRKKAGSFGDLSVFSLYATKTLASGEGGIIAFDNQELRDFFSASSDNGFYKGKLINSLGDSLRFSDIHATIALFHLKNLDELNAKRIIIAKQYHDKFNSLNNIILPSLENNVFHHYNIVIKKEYKFSFQEAYSYFNNSGIEIRQYYPYTLSSIFERKPQKTASYLSKNSFCIPIFPSLNTDQINKVSESTYNFLKGLKK